MKTFEKYKQNLQYDDKFIYSYDTKVAIIDKGLGNLVKMKWKVGKITSSPTTTRHINYASKELGLEVKERWNKKNIEWDKLEAELNNY